jgi:hypothetical protein
MIQAEDNITPLAGAGPATSRDPSSPKAPARRAARRAIKHGDRAALGGLLDKVEDIPDG